MPDSCGQIGGIHFPLSVAATDLPGRRVVNVVNGIKQ